MTSRERTLLAAVLGLLAVLGTGLLANSVFFQPLGELKQQVSAEEVQVNKLQGEIKLEKDYVARIEKLSPRLAQWKKLSLPEGDPKPEAFKNHLNTLVIQYQQYLNHLLTQSKVQRLQRSPGTFEARNNPNFDERTKKPIYRALTFSIQGETDLAGVVKLFEELSRTPLLQQVKSFSIASQRTSRNLTLKMTVEVLLVAGAQPIKKRIAENAANEAKNGRRRQTPQQEEENTFAKYKDIIPTFSGKGKDKPPVVLAPKARNYMDIVTRSIFTPQKGSGDSGGSELAPEPAKDVLYGVRLTMISSSNYYGCLVARMHNLGNKDDSALLIVGPLPKQSPYQDEKKELERRRKRAVSAEDMPKERLEEPVQSWIVKDRSKTVLAEVSLVRIEPLRVIIQVQEKSEPDAPKKLYLLGIGGNLNEIIDSPLDSAAIRKLGLTADPVEVLKKVKLAELKYQRDRKGYEAVFVNPENRDEKIVLSTEAKPEELQAPDEGSVHDRFGTEVLKVQVVRVDKDQLIFAANGKHYRIKLGETLGAVLARPLSADEIKALPR